MVSIWFLGGLIIFCVGVIGMYLAKIFMEIKQRPYTIIRAEYGSDPDEPALHQLVLSGCADRRVTTTRGSSVHTVRHRPALIGTPWSRRSCASRCSPISGAMRATPDSCIDARDIATQ